MKIVGLDRMLDTSSWNTLYLEIGLYHGGHLLCPAKGTSSLTVAGDTVFVNQTFKFEIAVCNIPKVSNLVQALNDPNTSLTIVWVTECTNALVGRKHDNTALKNCCDHPM